MAQDKLTTPVLFLIFNRPEVTRKVFTQIAAAAPTKLYLASDGARSNKPGEDELVQECKDIVLRGIDWNCEVETLFRDKNLGCKAAVSSAIDWFFSHEEEGIILEDDTLPSESFFTFCSEMLERYRDDKRIMKITGFNPVPESTVSLETSYLYTHYAFIWGWASWRRAWNEYDVKMSGWEEFKKQGKHLLYPFFPERVHLYDVTHAGKIDTWDYQWEYAIERNSALQIVPKVSLIQNIGFGADATHTKVSTPTREKITADELKFPLTHPEFIYPEAIYEKSILKSVKPTFKTTCKRIIKKTLIKVGLWK